MKKTKQQIAQNKEILWNTINSILAGLLVLLGSLSNGFSQEAVAFAIIAACLVAVTKFSSFWSEEKKEYCNLFSFI